MIDLKQLIRAIEDSVAGAAETLRKQNLSVLSEFFEPVGDADELEELAREAIDSAEAAAKADDEKSVRASLRKATEAIESVARAIRCEGDEARSALRPLTVDMEYPQMTADGPKVHTVTVPLIALAPVSSFQLARLKLTADVDLELVDEELKCSFPPRHPVGTAHETKDSDDPRAGTAKLEIEINASQAPPGLEILIEGYDRALRAQIPG